MGKNNWRIVTDDEPCTFSKVSWMINELVMKYPFLSSIPIGKSYLGRNVEMIRLGGGSLRRPLFVGTHHGMEWITALILLRFTEDLARAASDGSNMYGCDIRFVLRSRSICIIPMLNPDGAELAVSGIGENNPVAERLISANGGSRDFSRWQANARGVDLNHNYDADWQKLRAIEESMGISGPSPTRYGGEYPESEPETAALCSFIRTDGGISSLTALHTQGEVIYWRYGEDMPPRSEMLAKILSKSTSYALDEPEGEIASYGGCKDWFISEYNRPAFTVECGKGENPLPLSDFHAIYSRIAEGLLLMILNG